MVVVILHSPICADFIEVMFVLTAAVISMAELLSDTAHHGKLDLCLHDLGCSMRLDAAAQKALNMFPQRTDEAKLFSLYGLLNQARTAMGKRKLKVNQLTISTPI